MRIINITAVIECDECNGDGELAHPLFVAWRHACIKGLKQHMEKPNVHFVTCPKCEGARKLQSSVDVGDLKRALGIYDLSNRIIALEPATEMEE